MIVNPLPVAPDRYDKGDQDRLRRLIEQTFNSVLLQGVVTLSSLGMQFTNEFLLTHPGTNTLVALSATQPQPHTWSSTAGQVFGPTDPGGSTMQGGTALQRTNGPVFFYKSSTSAIDPVVSVSDSGASVAGQISNNFVAWQFGSGDTGGDDPAYVTARARGTMAAPTAVLVNDTLGTFSCAGQYDSTPRHVAATAGFLFFARENFSATNQGSYLRLYLTPLASATVGPSFHWDTTTFYAVAAATSLGLVGNPWGASFFNALMTIQAGGLTVTAGNVAVGTTPLTDRQFYASGNTFGAQASVYGLVSTPTSPSTATGSVVGAYVSVNTSAAAYSSIMYGLFVDTGTKGAGSTVTSQYGLYVNSQTLSTTSYAIFTNAGLVSIGDATTFRSGGVTISAGNLGISGAPASNAFATLSGNIASSGGFAQALTLSPTVDSGTITGGWGVTINVATATATFTASAIAAINIGDAVKGAGSTITTQYGVHLDPQTKGTVNYAWYSNAGLMSFGDITTVRYTAVTGTYLLVGGGGVAGTGPYNYSSLDLLRISGVDTTNTIYNAGRNIAITRDTGGTIFIGQTSSTTVGVSVSSTAALVGIGIAATTAQMLTLSGTVVSSGNFGNGIVLTPTFDSGTTTTGFGITLALATAAAAFTAANLIGLNIGAATKGAGSTITALYGIKIADQTQGGTNYALFTGLGRVVHGGATAGVLSSATSLVLAWGTTQYLEITDGTKSFVAGVDTSANGILGMFSNHALDIRTNNTGRWTVTSVGHFIAVTDNTYDIGASAATRPRNLFLAGFADIAGNVGINTAHVSNQMLTLSGTVVSSGTFGNGIVLTPTFDSGTTGTGYGVNLALATAAATFTVANLIGLNIGIPTKGAGSTITTLYGIKIADQTQGGTNYSIFTGNGRILFGGGTQAIAFASSDAVSICSVANSTGYLTVSDTVADIGIFTDSTNRATLRTRTNHALQIWTNDVARWSFDTSGNFVANLTNGGTVQWRPGTQTTNTVKAPGVAFQSNNATTTSATTATVTGGSNGGSYTLKGNTLVNNGDSVRIVFNAFANANSGTATLKIGAVTIINAQALSSNGGLSAEVWVTRRDATHVDLSGDLMAFNSSVVSSIVVGLNQSLDLTVDQTIVFQGSIVAGGTFQMLLGQVVVEVP